MLAAKSVAGKVKTFFNCSPHLVSKIEIRNANNDRLFVVNESIIPLLKKSCAITWLSFSAQQQVCWFFELHWSEATVLTVSCSLSSAQAEHTCAEADGV